MGKHNEHDPWKKFKRSFSQLSLSGKLVTDLTDMNVRPGGDPHESHEFHESGTDASSMCESDRDRELTPLFSSTSTVDLNSHPPSWGNPEVVSIAPSENPPPRLEKRPSSDPLPPRKHPYPSNFGATFKTYHNATNFGGFRQLFFNRVSPKRRSVVVPKRISGASLAAPGKTRVFKKISIKLRRCFGFSSLRYRKRNSIQPAVVAEQPPAESCNLPETPQSTEKDPGETLYSRVLRVALEMDLDESSMGSIIMILGEEPVVQTV